MPEPRVLVKAEFDRRVVQYWVLRGTILCAISIVGIVLLPIWVLVGPKVAAAHLRRLRCTLTERTLEVRHGWLIRTEQTIPLEKITDLAMVQGPIMRWLGLQGFRVETAGGLLGSYGGGHLVALVGIIDAPGFRRSVLDQRDDLWESRAAAGAPGGPARDAPPRGDPGDQASVLREIRDTLARIEQRLADSSPRG